MRMIVMSAVFALGLGVAGTSGTMAATSTGETAGNNAANSSSLVKQALVCRNVKVCARGEMGRVVCTMKRVCR